MSTKKIKRGRGRPTAEMQQIYAMDDAQAKVKELFAANYLEAMEYIVGLLSDKDAAKTLKFQAAKTIKDQVEGWLDEHYESLEEEDEVDETAKRERIVI
ncbi:hypothetical protein [Citrobacter phage Tr1]|nr:hypothetical protein [Citrobacter phage Tr1]